MDSERLKNGGSVLIDKYFEEQLEKIREIRLCRRKILHMKQSEILQKLNGFLSTVGNGEVKSVIEKMQAMMDYQAEKIRIYEDKLCELTGRERPELNDDDRKRLAHRGSILNDYLLSIAEPTWCPDTIRGWHRDWGQKKI